jgi:hypothetical protein
VEGMRYLFDHLTGGSILFNLLGRVCIWAGKGCVGFGFGLVY